MNPEQPLFLMVTSDRWGMRATSQVPSAHLVDVAIEFACHPRRRQVFDEFELNLTRDEGAGKWHLVQLLLQVDTVLAPPPTAETWSDDPHVLVRKHGSWP